MTMKARKGGWKRVGGSEIDFPEKFAKEGQTAERGDKGNRERGRIGREGQD